MADGMVQVDWLDKLALPFPDAAISWRVGSTNVNKQTGKPPEGEAARGQALAYIDARDVQNRLDTVCGVANWSDKYLETEKGRIICTLSIRVDGEWISKSDGAGDSDVESEKGAISDALKRAAVKWGIGRYLYDMESPWVDLQQRGRSWIMTPKSREKLDNIHSNYVRKNFKNAAPSDAGQRETPKSQQAADAAVSPPDAASANFHNRPSNVPGGFKSLKTIEVDEEQRTDHTLDPEWTTLSAQLTGNCECRADVLAWWEARKKDLKARKPHFAKAFYQDEVIPFAASFAQTVVYEDEPGARG